MILPMEDRVLMSVFDVLSGKRDIKKEDLEPIMVEIGKVIRNPVDLPFALEKLCQDFQALDQERQEGLRYGLVRVQIDSDLRQYEDMQTMQSRKYVSQVLEKLFYGDLLLEGEPCGDEGEEEG